ncbi:unnamed protein product [Prunus armeniaca]
MRRSRRYRPLPPSYALATKMLLRTLRVSLSTRKKLTAQKVKGYFDLLKNVREKYPSLDWSFLEEEAERTEAKQGEGGIALITESVIEGAGLTPSGTNRATISVEPVVVGPNPVVQGTEATSTGADLASERVVWAEAEIGIP